MDLVGRNAYANTGATHDNTPIVGAPCNCLCDGYRCVRVNWIIAAEVLKGYAHCLELLNNGSFQVRGVRITTDCDHCYCPLLGARSEVTQNDHRPGAGVLHPVSVPRLIGDKELVRR